MRKNALFMAFACAFSLFFSSPVRGDVKGNTAASQDRLQQQLLQQQIEFTEASIQQLELEKSSYDSKAAAIGREADRIQFQFYTRARDLYNQQERYQSMSNALAQQIEALRQKKEKLIQQLKE